MPKSVFIINGNKQYEEMFTSYGWDISEDFMNADLIQFTGGSDVSPELYGATPHAKTHSSKDRDLFEMTLFGLATGNGTPMAGICRGGQFLNVMCGGSLYQHITDHCSPHDVKTEEGQVVMASSTHHQMMIPAEDGRVILVSDPPHRSKSISSLSEARAKKTDNVEGVVYSASKVLCFQPHPEYPCYDNLTVLYMDWVKRLITEDVF